MPQQITVTVSPTGDAKVEASGYRGASCVDATRQLEEALGKTSADAKTPEFFGRTAANKTQQQQARQ